MQPQHTGGDLQIAGSVTARHLRSGAAPLGWRVQNFIEHRHRSVPQLAVAAGAGLFGIITLKPSLAAIHYRRNPHLHQDDHRKLTFLLSENEPIGELARAFGGRITDYGVVSRRVITTAGVGALVDAWQNILELEILKFHGVGTGTNAENSSDTALQTESTTIINPDSTRATGSLTEGASANIFRTVGTVTFDGSGAITEHGIFSQAATGGGTLWDRSVFSAINVVNLDSIQFTYDMTASAGG